MADTPALAPQPPTAPARRHIDAGRGYAWWADSASWMFRDASSLFLWIGMAFCGAVLEFIAGFIPHLGTFAGPILTFLFAGGLALAAQKTAARTSPQFGDLFAGFGPKGGALLAGGLIVAFANLAVMLVMGAIGLFAFFHAVWVSATSYSTYDLMTTIMNGLETALIALLVGLILYFLIGMAAWFAPALIVLRGSGPIQALGASFLACQRHFLAFLVYGLIAICLAVLSFLTLGLGWLIILPWTILSTYAAFVDIFDEPSVEVSG